MSLSKYTDLPDIDTAGQDLYETPEAPSPSYSDDEVDDVLNSASGAGRGSTSASASASGAHPRRSAGGPGAGAGTSASASSAAGGGALAQNHLDVEGATAKFRRATEADARGADFSGALHVRARKPAQHYPSPLTFETDTYQIRGYSSSSRRRRRAGGAGRTGFDGSLADKDDVDEEEEEETPLDKLRRLRAETQALEEELQAQADAPQQDDGAGAASASATRGEDGVSPVQILEQLRKLRTDLARLDAPEDGSGGGGGAPPTFGPGAGSWEVEARALIEKLGVGTGSSSTAPAEDGEKAGAGGATAPPTATTMGPSRELAQLETRLAGLEDLVGVRPALVDEKKAPSRPLLPTMQRLEHQLTLFTQPRHLDAISRRVKVLVAELERAHEARAKLAALGPGPGPGPSAAASKSAGEHGGQGGDAAASPSDGNGNGNASTSAGPTSSANAFGTPDQLARLRALFALQTRLEPLLPLAPHLLTRLQSLSALHASSAHFASSLEHLLDADARLGERAAEVRELCVGLEKSMEEDAGRVRGNLEVVQARVEALGKRMEALGV